eukprot:CAMPEP_0119034940 /NCGR_PEP_ID=MMETSP1177-20130426/1953_1 /TAXON_ID=2985 /ORGANISM="Ochromonas sp, Strain CCMP1899" /LENGTH=315 /DNA_ID=CAMNT_0006992779 /DNA_START=595 /DNA_END=1542 /DNA_ORIENTATION=+
MIRKDPDFIRKANPIFQKMSDEQIRAYADQLEQAASDPNMMKEVQRNSQLSPKEREQLQSIQEGLQGLKPIDDAWLDGAIATLKSNSGFFKAMVKGKGAMFGGVSDEQIGGFIDMAASQDAGTLKFILKIIKYLGSWAQPLSELYDRVDKMTFGSGRYILFGLVSIVLYFSFFFWLEVARYVFGKIFGFGAGAAVAGSTPIPAGATVGTVGSVVGGAAPAVAEVVKDTVIDLTGSKVQDAVLAAGIASAAGASAASAADSAADSAAKGKGKWGSFKDKIGLGGKGKGEIGASGGVSGGEKVIKGNGEAVDAEFDI